METSLINANPDLILEAIIAPNYKYEQRSFQLNKKRKEKINLSSPQIAAVNSEVNAYKAAMIKACNLYTTPHIKPIPKSKIIRYVYFSLYF